MDSFAFFQSFIELVSNLFNQILQLLNSRYIASGISLLFVFLGAIALRMIINIFWKGEKG